MSPAARVRPLRVAAVASAQRALAERGSLVVMLGFYVAVVFALSSLWRTAAGAHGGFVVGYSVAALTWYVATSEAVTVSMNIRLIEEIGEDISSGAIAVELLRPVSVLGLRVATHVGRALPRAALCATAGAALASLVAGAPPRPAALALAVPAIVLALACNIVAQHAFAAAAFWVRETRSSWFLYQKLVFVLGGMLLPLEVLPDRLESVAKLLPFMAMAYAPARIASGHIEPHLLLLQVGWLAILSGLAAVIFSAGERRLQTVGG
jgi:ABC-2 type transport system permease protein